jgi:HK97 family phage major capsid protein
MSATPSVADYIQQARAAIADGKLDEAETLTKQASALKALDSLAPTVDPAARLPFATEAAEAATTPTESVAIKSWYTRKYGDDGAAMDQVMDELYGANYKALAWAKTADFVRYIRSGRYDEKLHRSVVYSPSQVAQALADGMSVSELKATQVESQDTLGGYLVPEDIRDQIVQRLVGMTAMRKIAGQINTTRDRVTMPVGTGGDDRYTGAVRAAWVDESPTGAQSNTNATFGQVTIPIHVLMANVDVSKNLIEDSAGASAILPYLTQQFSDAFAIKEDDAFLLGDGVGKPQGVLQNATTGGPWTYTYGSVTTLNSGGATALTGDSFRNMPYQIASQYRNSGCVWIMSRGSVRVTKTLKDGSGAYLWGDRQFQLLSGQPRQIEGYDILESEALATTTATNGVAYTANVYPVIFIAKGAYQIVDRVGMDVQRYDDATTAVGNAIRLVARRRVGGQVLNPWGVAVMKVAA